MWISDAVIQEICEKNDIVSVISSYMALKPKGNKHWGVCPFHSEKTPSFSVDASRQMFYCFGCHAAGSVITFVMKYERLDFSESVEKLAQNVGISIKNEDSRDADSRIRQTKKRLLTINKAAATYYYKCLKEPSGAAAARYLADRGLNADIINSFGLGFAPNNGNLLLSILKNDGFSDQELIDSGIAGFTEKRGLYTKFWNRVMFPIQDLQGRVIGFGGRVIKEGEPKYLNTSDTAVFEKGQNLFAQHIARKNAGKFFILCEGYMDVIALHRAGFTQAMASLGTAFTAGQAILMKRFCDTAYIAYDSDSAGVRATLRCLPILLAAGITAKVIDLSPYKDPDELICNLGSKEFENRIDNAQNAFLYEIGQLKNDYNLNDPAEKTAFFKETAKRIADFSSDLERDSYIGAIAQKYLIRTEQLKSLVKEYAFVGVTSSKNLRTVQAKPMGDKVIDKGSKAVGAYNNKRGKPSTQQAQEHILRIALTDKDLLEEVKQTLLVEDFEDEVYSGVYKLLIEGSEINPQNVVNAFDAESGQSKAAALFFEADESLDKLGPEEKKRQMGMCLRVIKQKGIELRSQHLDGNIDEYLRLLKAKRDAEKL